MSMWNEVLESLQAMGLRQLFFAFVACTGYALVQGHLVGQRMKWTACALTVVSLFAFVLETERWVDGVMLVAVGLTGLGAFVAGVWSLCHVLGMSRTSALRSFDSLQSLPPTELDAAAGAGRALAPTRHAAASH